MQTFNNLQYHGTVSWSWQQGLMASGISRQLGLCGLSNQTQLATVSGQSRVGSPLLHPSSLPPPSLLPPHMLSYRVSLTYSGIAPDWCRNQTLKTQLQQAQIRLWDSITGSAPALYTEVLSPVFNNSTGVFSIGDLGAISPSGTEGDAIQLWSYGFLAEVDPRSGRAVAGGFP